MTKAEPIVVKPGQHLTFADRSKGGKVTASGDILTRTLKKMMKLQKVSAFNLRDNDPIGARVVVALLQAATNPESRNFMGAQNLVWDRVAGKVKETKEHHFPQVSESLSVYTGRVDVPLPLKSAEEN